MQYPPYIALAVLFALTGCESGLARSQRERLEAEAAARRTQSNQFFRDLNHGRLNLDHYDVLEPGMDYEQVAARLGGEGVEISTTREGEAVKKTYEWSDPAHTVSVTFVDDKLTSKSRSGR